MFKRDNSFSEAPIPSYPLTPEVRSEAPRPVATEIVYKPAIAETMTAVVKDFVIRWSHGFDAFYLNELCDRAKSVHFVKGLVVAVEQDLRGASVTTAAHV